MLSAAMVLVVTVLLALVIAPSVLAAPKGAAAFFGNPVGTSNSTLTGQFGANSPLGVAVNTTGAGLADPGDIYVVDTGNNRIQRFGSLGEFKSMWGKDVIANGSPSDPTSVTTAQVCTVAADCKAGVTGSLGGELTTPRAIAVDQATGNVYVAERNVSTDGERVQAFTADGQFLWVLGKDAITNGSPSDPTSITTTQVCTVAADCKSPASGTLGGELGIGGTNSSAGGANGIAVSPVINPLTNAGNVLVTDRANRRVQEFTSTGGFVRAFGADVVAQGGSGNTAVNEVQRITVSATAGTFTLTSGANTTAALAYDASAATVQTALNGLASINAGGGSVTVTGGPGDVTGSSPYLVTFDGGPRADADVPQITVNATALLAGVGKTLSCTGGPASATTTFSYQWLRNGAAIAGATNASYMTVADDVGTAVQCQAFAITANAGATQVNTPAINVAPAPGGARPAPPGTIAAPTITTGTIAVGGVGGATLTCVPGSWSGAPTFAYQWYRNGVPLVGNGATTNVYTVQTADLATAAVFQCKVTGTNANGGVALASANRATTAAPSPAAPTATSAVAALAVAETLTQGATTLEICTVAAQCKVGAATGAMAGQFADNTPNRVAVDSTGAIYTVENTANFRVQKFTPQAGPPALSPAIVNPNVGGSGPALNLTGADAANSPLDVAIGSANHALVLKAFPAGVGTPAAVVAERRVVELDSAGALIDIHGSRSGIPAAIYVATNTSSGDIYLSTGAAPACGGTGVYVLGASTAPTVSLGVGGVGTHAAELNGLANPGGPGTVIGFRTKYHFEYRKVGAPTWTALSADKDAGNGFATIPVNETLSDLEANTDYEAKLVASKQCSGVTSIETAPEAFTTQASRPDIDAAYATQRNANSATLNARINPNGEATAYHFEYGPTAAYGTTVPATDGNAGAGTAAQLFSEPIAGLTPDTTYHFRVTATNANGVNRSTDRTFTTLAEDQAPNGRAYELVSPADKVGGSGLGPWYAGRSAHALAGIPARRGDRYASGTYYGASLADGGFSYGSDWTLGERTPAGWINRPAFNRQGGFGIPEFAKLPAIAAVSDSLSLTAWDTNNSPLQLFAEQAVAWEGVAGTARGQALRDWSSGRWEIAAPVFPSHLVGSDVKTTVAPGGGYALVVGSIRGVSDRPGDPPSDPTSSAFTGDPGDWVPGNRNVYIDDVTAGLSDSFPGDGIHSLVSVCTGANSARTAIPSVNGAGKIVEEPCPDVVPPRSVRMVSPRGASLALSGAAHGIISDDGSRVFFMSPDHLNSTDNVPCSGSGAVDTKCPPQLYVRQRNGDGSATTRWISRSTVPGQDASLMATAVFEGATPDGDKVFFRTASPLTTDDPNGGVQVPGGVKTGSPSAQSVDLYMYDFPNSVGADPGDGTLTRISAGPNGSGDGNVSTDSVDSPTSALRALGDDGSRVYFATAAPLPAVAAPADGTITHPGGTRTQTATKNLYLYDSELPVDQRWRFVALLPASSALGGCAASGAVPSADGLTAGGGVLAGQVDRSTASNCVRATADGSFVTMFTDGRLTADDPDSVTGDVYSYDAVSDELVRLSAPQGGAAGSSYACVTDPISGPALGTHCHGDLAIGSAPLNLVVDPSDPAQRTAFFESASPLVPEDHNDVYDVYQWRDGKLSLLSTGDVDAQDALYRGSDRSGENVYISTRDRLTWQDHDVVLDVYAARAGGGIPQPDPPPACSLLADGCQGDGAGAVAVDAETPSATSDGNADEGARKTLAVAAPSAAARRSASRSGVLKVVVRTNAPGSMVVVAKARIGKRVRRVARTEVAIREAGKAALAVRLSDAARRRIQSGNPLRLNLRVTFTGARARAIAVRLPGVKP